MDKSRYRTTPKEVAAELNVHVRTAQRMCERGEIPALKVGKLWRIRSDWRSHLGARTSRD